MLKQAHISRNPQKGFWGFCWGYNPSYYSLKKNQKKNKNKKTAFLLNTHHPLALPLPLLHLLTFGCNYLYVKESPFLKTLKKDFWVFCWDFNPSY